MRVDPLLRAVLHGAVALLNWMMEDVTIKGMSLRSSCEHLHQQKQQNANVDKNTTATSEE